VWKLKRDEPLSNFSFEFNLRRCNEEVLHYLTDYYKLDQP